MFRACLEFFFFITHHSSLNFHHLSLITHHLKYPTLFVTIIHFSSLNIFQLFVGPIPGTWSKQNCFVGPTIFSFFISPPSPLLFSQNTNPNPASTTTTTNPNLASTTRTKTAATTTAAAIATTTKQARTQLQPQ